MNLFFFSGTRKPDFKNIQFFDYDDYWKHRGIHLAHTLKDREYIFMNWVSPNSSVLDAACGDSLLLSELKNQKNCDVKGFDISPLILEKQKENGISTEVQDLSSDGFELKEKFDYILLSEVLEHLVFPEKLIEKLKKRATFLLISIPNSAFYRYRIGLLLTGRFFTQWAFHPAEHVRFWSHTDFLDWLDAMGLEVIKSEASNGLKIGPIKLFKFWENLFGHQICYLVKVKEVIYYI